MALNYLLSPEFQIVNTAGRPATGGYLEVFIHGSRERYYCASDFNGTLYPFQVPLDALGGNVVLADDANAYDVYAYNRYGGLLMSRYNVHPSSGGSMGGVITSTDGSVTVTATENGYDLSVNDNKASTLKAAADTLYEDGFYSFRFKEGEGDQITIQNGSIILQDGWYHFSATVKLNWTGINVNQTDQLKLYTALTYDIIDFDYSYNHVDTIMLDGDIYIAPHSTQYISYGRTFTLAVLGMHTGLSAELVDLDIHSITGHGFAGGGEKNIHRLLRYYTNASEADAEHPVGDWLHDLDSDDPNDPSGHPMVTADQLFAWYAAGQNFELYEVDGTNGQLGWSAVYRMVTWQDQSDWWSQSAAVPGKACRLEFFRMGMYSTPYRGGLIAYIRYQDEDYMRLYEIMPGQSIWMAEYQEKLPHYDSDWHNGDFLRVKQNGSDLEWVPLSGVALSGSYNDLSDVPANLVQDADYVHTDNNFTDNDKDKLDNIEAGAQVNVQSDWTETDASDDAYIKHKPGTKPVAAGDNITITETASQFVISAADQQQANWNESDTSSAQYIQNKPDLSVYATTQDMNTALAGKQDVISDLATIRSGAALGATATQPADLAAGLATKQDVISDLATIRSGAALGATSVQPADLAPYATTADMNTALAGKQDVISDLSTIRSGAALGATSVQPSDLATVATTGDYGDLLHTPTVDQTYDATSTNAQSGVAVASAIANNGLFEATYGTTTLSEVVNAISAHKVVYCRVSGRMAFLAYIGSSNVEFQYYRSNSQGTGDSVFIYTVSSNGWTTTERPAYVQSNWNTTSSSDAAYIRNKPSIPTKTSDLTNDSGYITASDVPAQVQADWTESDTTSAAYIANKPNLALKEDVANKAQTLVASSTTDYPSSAATAQFVNSSIATATARFLGNYTLTDLGLTYPATDAQIETALDGYTFQSAPTNNDYVYVEIQNPQTTSVDDVVKRFKFNGTNWLYEYTLNNSSFTAAEIAAIDSGVNSTKVGNYDNHIADTTIHVTAADKTAWNGKQDAISDLSDIRSGAALGATSVQPSDLATVATTGDYSDLLNTPTLAAVATSGDYTDLSNTPHIPVIGTVTL